MTILFWLLAAAMLLVALSLLLPALTSGGRDGGVERDKLNIAVFHDQLKELENERAEGTLSEDQFEAARRELQRELLDEVGEGEAQATHKPRGRFAVPVVALLVPSCSQPPDSSRMPEVSTWMARSLDPEISMSVAL